MMNAGEIPVVGSTEYIEWMTSMQNYVYELVMKYSMLLTLISGILALVTFFVIMKARKKRPLADIGLTRINPWLALELIGLGAALNVFVTFAMSIIPFPVEWINSYVESSSMLADANVVISIIVHGDLRSDRRGGHVPRLYVRSSSRAVCRCSRLC